MKKVLCKRKNGLEKQSNNRQLSGIRKIYLWICDLARKLRRKKYGKKIWNFLEIIGIQAIADRVFRYGMARENEKNPTALMIQSRTFFEKNNDRVKNVLSLLCDQESKDVFSKMIDFRCFSVYKKLPNYSVKTQYFFNDFFNYSENEVFVDCGAYNGDTIRKFKKYMKTRGKNGAGGGIRKIVAFEPDTNNYNDLVRNHPDIVAIQAGAWDKDGELSFLTGRPSGSEMLFDTSKINIINKQEDIIKVPVKSIDNTEECRDATFIKMDIEGSEYNALLGAHKVIVTNKPKLAICIYHSDEDMLRIAELLHKMVPEYRFYIRQHSNTSCETVLYAVC